LSETSASAKPGNEKRKQASRIYLLFEKEKIIPIWYDFSMLLQSKYRRKSVNIE
jgi:hypothetical protein